MIETYAATEDRNMDSEKECRFAKFPSIKTLDGGTND